MGSTANQLKIIITTVNDPQRAAAIGRELLERRLIACCNSIPGVSSQYRWKNQIETDEEYLLVLKTASERVDNAMAHLEKIHPYEVPEIIILEPEQVANDYLNWVINEVRE